VREREREKESKREREARKERKGKELEQGRGELKLIKLFLNPEVEKFVPL